MKFKKISAIAGSILMAGLTAATAAAASFPMPFVEDGKANVAIVYGADADMVAANNVHTALGKFVTGTTTVTGGDSYKFEKTSTRFHLGDHYINITTNLDEDELPNLLADGKYIDNDNDEIDYTQKIVMGPLGQLTMFEDNDYMEDEPVVGFKIPSGQLIMTYTLTFDDTLYVADMPTSDLPIMGTEYYVLSNTTTTLTLLDSATETILTEGETAVIGGKSVSIDFIGSNQVKLTIDGETTNTLGASETYKLNDDSYVGIKDILYSSKEGSASKVEFSIGSGKLKITDSADVQINDESISGLVGTLVDSAGIATSLTLAWSADDDLFITEDSTITMPGFEEVSLSFGGLDYPMEETIEVKQGGDLYATLENFPLKDGEADINFLYATTAGTFAGLGKDANNRLVTAATGVNMTFDKDTDDYFVVSWTDSNDAESYLMRATNFVLDGSTNKTDIEYYKDGSWVTKKSGASDGDEITIGNAAFKVWDINRVFKNLTLEDGTETNFHELYSKEGMVVYLPYEAENGTAQGAIDLTASGDGGGLTAGHNATSFYLVFQEEDKNENKYSGDWINVTVGWDSSSTPEVEVSDVDTQYGDASSTEIGDTDVWRDFTYSALATEILFNKPSSGQKSVKLMYHGDEVAADVFVTSADAVKKSSSTADFLPVKDTEIDNVKSKNLIIVGGSCINSAAATALGGAYCGEEFTQMTGVGMGQFLIQGVMDKFATGKMALVVAGYEAADTKNAVTYLTKMDDVDTSTKMVKGVESIQGLA